MVRHVDAIFSKGTFQPLEPMSLAEGARVHLRIEDEAIAAPVQGAAKIRTPRLAHPEDAGDFVMEVREAGDAPL